MVELDDAVTKIDLGLEEYSALSALEVKTIRQLLLLDVDRVISLRVYNHITAERISIWQKLLRKYLTYEKLHEARKKEELAEEEYNVHGSISHIDLPTEDIALLQSLGIKTPLEFLEVNLAEVIEQKGYDQPTSDHIVSLQNDLSKKDLIAKASHEASIYEELRPSVAFKVEKPEKTVSPEEFLDEPIIESGMNPGELDVLASLNVITIHDFLDFDMSKVQDLKGYSENVFLRLSSWQKFLRKRMNWGKLVSEDYSEFQ